MRFMCPVLAVKDINRSRKFYETVLNQKVTLDLGKNITFEDHFAIQSDFEGLIGIAKNDAINKHNNFIGKKVWLTKDWFEKVGVIKLKNKNLEEIKKDLKFIETNYNNLLEVESDDFFTIQKFIKIFKFDFKK